MKTNMKGLTYVTMLTMMLCLASCGKDDNEITPDKVKVKANFTNTELSLKESVEVDITFSRPVEIAGSLTVQLVADDLTYGKEADFYTDPAMVSDTIVVNYDAGVESVSISVKAGTQLNIKKESVIKMTLKSATDLELGSSNSLVVKISENFVAKEGVLSMNTGESSFEKQAFVDLSKKIASNADKGDWDLAFLSSGFHVTLNATGSTMARKLDGKTDLKDVSASDTTGFAAKMVVGFASSLEAQPWIDDPSGDLTKTAIAEISATDSENPIYIIKRDGDKSWKKIRIHRSGENYKIQFADIASTTFTEKVITKKADYNATFFSLDDKIVSFEPLKAKWDFMYGTYTVFSTFGKPIPYGFKDFIVINREKTSVVMVKEEGDVTYDKFSTSSVSSLSFESNLNTIGSSWRSVIPSPKVKDDQFYVIKDSEGNVYKLKFTKLTNDSDQRGYPQLKYELL